MTDQQQAGARYFPFGVGAPTRHDVLDDRDVLDGREALDGRDVLDGRGAVDGGDVVDGREVVDDREAQRAAVARSRAHGVAVAAARTLWPVAVVAILVAIFYGEQTSDVTALVAVGVLVLSLLGSWALYRGADRLLAAVRRADEEVGIPVPEDLVSDVEQAGVPVSVLAGWFGDLEPRNPHELRTLRQARRRSAEIERRFVTGLHRVRRCWVRGDLEGWRRAARDLEAIAQRATVLDAELTGRMADPAMDDPAVHHRGAPPN